MSGQAVSHIDIPALVACGEPIQLELGCGTSKTAGRIGIDQFELPGVDIVADAIAGLKLFPDKSVDRIYSSHFFEHVEDLEELMRQICRVLKPDGLNILVVPHFSNPYYYSDFTHRKFFGLYTFYYFANHDRQMSRKVLNFYTDVRIEITYLRLLFLSEFRFRHPIKKFIERVVNFRPWMREFYEENLCYIFPCFAMEVHFRPDPRGVVPNPETAALPGQ